AGRLPRRNLAALEGLLHYRAKLAGQKDRPLFKVFSNTALLKIASEMADTPQALEAARCLSPKQIRIFGKDLGAVVKQAKSIAPADLPVYPRRRRKPVAPEVPERINAIKTWRDAEAQRLGLDPALLFNKAMMTAIAVHRPATIAALRDIEGIRNWQVKAFGKHLVSILSTLP
ncbi:MAG: HRDC domain-containing protein, partial [Desulfobacteraceae bacterium]|nr:HRDC domain-containing protein [Desulfobacteraceae bacterium]